MTNKESESHIMELEGQNSSNGKDQDDDEAHVAALEDNPDTPQKLSLTTFCAIFFLGLSIVCPTSLGFLTVSAILIDIGTALGSTADIQWIVSAYAIGSCVSFPIAGSLSDIFGRRYVIITGQSIAIVGAICGAVAQQVTTVIAAGALFGFATGIVLTTYAAIPELCPNKYRGIGLAWIEACILFPWGTFSVLLGKTITFSSSWRWIYIAAAIYGAVSLIGTFAFYFPPTRQKSDERSKWMRFKQLDFIALALFTGGLSVLLVGLSWAGSAGHPWRSASVTALIILGTLVLCSSFAYDWLVVKEGNALFPLHLFVRFREYTVLLIVMFVAGMIFYSMAALLPQASLFIFSSDHVQLGLIQLPNGCGQTFGAIFGPMLLHKTKNIKVHILIALFIQTVGVGLYSYALPSHKAAWMAFQFFGQGCFSWLSVCCIMNAGLHVRQSELGLATGLIGTFRSLGGSFGSSIFGTIRSGVLSSHLGPGIARAAAVAGFDVRNKKLVGALIAATSKRALTGSPHAFDSVPGITPAVEAAALTAFRQAQAYAYSRVFYATIPFGIIAILAAIFISDASKYMTNHTAVKLKKEVRGLRRPE